jgi:HAD superfamily hydrolase (TIGR01509 family)
MAKIDEGNDFMARLEALIFDVDGTLAETEKDGHRVAFNQAFKAAGLAWEWDVNLYGDLLKVAGGKERIGYFLENFINFEPPENLERFITNLHQTKNKFYQDFLVNATIPLRSGVAALITEAYEEGVRLAIATTSALPNAIALLDHTIGSEYFEIIAAGDIVSNKKPAPDIYNYVLKKLNLSTENCLVIEDSEAGLEAATAANLKTVITYNDYTKNHNFDSAFLVLNSLENKNLKFFTKIFES